MKNLSLTNDELMSIRNALAFRLSKRVLDHGTGVMSPMWGLLADENEVIALAKAITALKRRTR